MKTSIHYLTDPGSYYRLVRALGRKEVWVLRPEGPGNYDELGFVHFGGYFTHFLPCFSYEEACRKQTELLQR